MRRNPLDKYSERMVSDMRDIPAKLPEGVDRRFVESQWNNVPLVEPPPWWDDDNPPDFAEGKSWLAFLVDEWHQVLLQPPTLEEMIFMRGVERMGRQLTSELDALAIKTMVPMANEERPGT